MNDLLEMIGNLQDCPWAKWAPATLRFCEAHVCERIVAPAETWSNIPYLLVGLWLLIQGLRTVGEGRGFANIQIRFGIYAFLVGICSSLFHASYTYVFETADLAAMNFLGVEMVIQALSRLGWFKGQSPVAFGAILFTGAFLVLLGTVRTERLWVFSAFVAVVFWLEGLIFVRARRAGTVENYRGLFASIGLFAFAHVFWMLDYRGLVCVPDRHWFSGHAAWHVLNAGCFLTLSAFYRSRYA
jgi:hypothetical protein